MENPNIQNKTKTARNLFAYKIHCQDTLSSFTPSKTSEINEEDKKCFISRVHTQVSPKTTKGLFQFPNVAIQQCK